VDAATKTGTDQQRALREGHRATLRMSHQEVVKQLVERLGPTLVAALADVRDSKLPYKWMKSDGPRPGDGALSRLNAALRAWNLIANWEDEHVARAWFIGANPDLGELSPIMELRSGATDRVLAAAQHFVEE